MKLKIIILVILLNFNNIFSVINISLNEYLKNCKQEPKTINANYTFEKDIDEINYNQKNSVNLKKTALFLTIFLISYTGYKIYNNKKNSKVIKHNLNN